VLRRGIERAALRHRAAFLRAALAALPLARPLNYGPDVELARIDAHARTRSLVGPANSRCRIFVNLAGSAPVDIEVLNEARRLGAGDHVAIDPSFVHHIAGTRVDGVAKVLWFDVWHPDLSADEQRAIQALIEAVVDFEMRVRDLP